MDLHSTGACVIPFLESIQEHRTEFEQTCQAFPEFVPLQTKDKAFAPTFMYSAPESHDTRKQTRAKYCNYYQLGGFGGLSNPGAFHNKFVRRLRLDLAQHAYPLFQTAYGDVDALYCQTLFDRMNLRPVGTHIKGESAHRDCGPVQADEWILQGWINLDHTPQFFSFVPGSHLDAAIPDQTGFVTNCASDETTRMKEEGVRLQVDPGHVVLFHQTLLHEVCPVKVTREHSMRLHVGFFFSPRPDGLFTPISDTAMRNQGLPRLPSGQVPPMYSKMHMSALRYKIVYPWSDACVRDYVKTLDRNRKLVCPRTLENVHLANSSTYAYPPYTDTEKALMRPQRIAWTSK